MKSIFYQSQLVLIALISISCSQNSSQNEQSNERKSYQQIHEEAIVIDGHNDFLSFTVDELASQYSGKEVIDFGEDLRGTSHIDLNRQKEAGLDVQFFSVFCPGTQVDPFDMAMRQIDTLEAIADRNSDKLTLVGNSSELMNALSEDKAIAMIGVEGGHMIEDDLDKLNTLYERRVRYMTLTWNNSTSWATSSYDESSDSLPRKGLTDFGEEIIRRMNQLGMIIDISHVGEQTFWDVMEVTSKPIIASHSSVYNICNFHRNLKDDQLKAIAENEGLVMVNFYPGFLDSIFWEGEIAFYDRHKEEGDSLMSVYNDNDWTVNYILYKKYAEEALAIRPPLSKLIDHIDYIAKLVGADHVGLGSDFDGITISPKQLDDVTDLPLITKELLERGYSEEDVKKILGGNFLRVLKANEAG